MSYSLGICVRGDSVLIVTDDFKYTEVKLFQPVGCSLKLDGKRIQLVALVFGTSESREEVYTAICSKGADYDFTNQELKQLLIEKGVEIRVITESNVHVFQFIQGEAAHGVIDGLNTSFWYGDNEKRKLFLPYCGTEGKRFREAHRDAPLNREFEFIYILRM